ncbi:NAD(P)H-binding protein [Sphingomonas sanxanigenens]|uniref:NAD(P)-binding domain-containing protein n=1 Tax=Sphingomonas sanxanigenens DSM 19645 = NX02 TaxID=1123269 RepID=W0A9B5_9SPHN|nr:NAD(P)H-binding protein [Sphingomonas sanxanigenens]AHE53067.1 hypothetical protein NX02_06685 [Sphingomonas sanxanigenens DSM 19645 = NX02]
MTRILIAGATGLVGRQALTLALADARVTQVVAPTRRPLEPHPKLLNPVVDFARLAADAPWWAVDGAICALGTTRATAGSAAAFRKVDLDHARAIAGTVRRHGATRFALVSSAGANPRSRFLYLRTKGELEQALRNLAFPALTILRPGFLGGHREEVRTGERVMGALLGALAPVLPRRMRISRSERVAEVLVEAAVAGAPGVEVLEAGEFV